MKPDSRKVLVPITNRVHWTRLCPLLRVLSTDSAFDLQIALGHAALLEGNGVVRQEMSLDGIISAYSFDFLLEGRSSGAMAKTAALGHRESSPQHLD
jgi:hypothetical protein